MADKAHLLTDQELERLAKELKSFYQKAYNDISKKLREELAKMNFSKDMTPAEYLAEAQKYDRLQKLEDTLSQSLKDANSEAVKMVNNELSNVYKTNYSWQADQIGGVAPVINRDTLKAVISGEVHPFKQLAIDEMKDRALIESNLRKELMSGILEGKPISEIATGIRGVFESNLAQSTRIARTETTRVEAAGRFDVGKEAQKLGFTVKKRWVATKDDRTRPSHLEADGQEVDLDKPFIVGGEEMMYPGDENASAENVINCRCAMMTVSVLEK